MLHKTEDGNAYGELDTGETTLAFAARRFVGSHLSIPVQKGGLDHDPPAAEIALVGNDRPGCFRQSDHHGRNAGAESRQETVVGKSSDMCATTTDFWSNSVPLLNE
jgi:hypothetical protein